MPYLILLNPDRTTTPLELTKDRIGLGSKPENDVVANVKGVSRHHAQVLHQGEDWILEDLDSTNFVFVNGEQVDHYVLTDNTQFSLGDYAFLLYLDRFDDEKIAAFVKSHVKETHEEHTTRIFHKSLPKTVRELEALIEATQHITGTLDLDDVLKTIIDKTLGLMSADRGFIMLLEEGKLVPKIARGMEAELDDGDRQSFSSSFARKVLEADKTLISTNVAEDPRYKSESIISQRIFSIMATPLKVREKIIGCLYIDVRQTTRYFSEDDAAFFSALANQAAGAIENARLTANLKKNQLFLEQTNFQLQKSLEKLIETNLKLDRKVNEISTLYDISRSLNMTTDMESVLSFIIGKSRQVLNAERSSLMMYNPKLDGLVCELADGVERLMQKKTVLKLGEGIAGMVAMSRKGIINNQGSKDPRFKYVSERDANIRRMLCVPLIAGEKTLGVLNLINHVKDQDFSEDDLELLTSMANLAAVSIEKFNLYKERLNQERLNLEIEDAQKVQQLLLPRELPNTPLFEFSAKYALANRVGGDYYDFIPIDEHRLAVVIADVSGHDIASALVMAMGRNLIRTLFDIHESPAKILAKTSLVLRQDTQASRYITMFLGILDSRDMSMTYSNAGHNYPLFLPAGSKSFKSLSVGGFPLGLVEDYNYIEDRIELHPDDLLVLYTDGLIEAQSQTGEMFELRRLEETIREYQDRTVEELCTTIYDKALEFSQSETLEDDFTFVAMRVRRPRQEQAFILPSVLDRLPTFVDRIADFIQGQGYFTADRFNLVLVLKEALTNAVEHGNQFDQAKKVHCLVQLSTKQLLIRIRDEGSGFEVPKVFSKQNKDLYRERGRGLIIISEYSDKVEFNDRGNEITLIFFKPPSGFASGNGDNENQVLGNARQHTDPRA